MHPRIPRREIAIETAIAFGVEPAELFSQRRSDRACRARFAACRLIREVWPETSTTLLGKVLNRDHTTIMAALLRGAHLEATQAQFAAKLDVARKAIAEWTPGKCRSKAAPSPAIEAESASGTGAASLPAETPETPRTVKSEPSSPFSKIDPRMGLFETDQIERRNLLIAEQRFLKIASEVHPERVRAFSKEAAE